MVMSPTKPSSFNTQPPEGGWANKLRYYARHRSFNTQPPEGGWAVISRQPIRYVKFQHTAARRRLGVRLLGHGRPPDVSTHSRPKAAGAGNSVQGQQQQKSELKFQHTAARRRLVAVAARLR